MDWLFFFFLMGGGFPVWPVDSSPISRQCKCKKDTVSIPPRSSVVTTFSNSEAVSSNAIGRLCKSKTQKPLTVTITQYNIFLSIFLYWSCIHNEAGHFTKCTNFNFNYNIIWTSRTESRNISCLLQTNCRAQQKVVSKRSNPFLQYKSWHSFL